MASESENLERLEHPCGTWEYHRRLLRRDSRYRRRFIEGQAFINEYLDRNPDAAFRLSPAVIPVVVHVVFNTAAQDLPIAAIDRQIDALNRDYSMANADVANAGAFFPLAANAQVQFQLAARDPNCQVTDGVTRTQTATTAFDIFNTDDVKAAATGGADPWPRDRYLNIWVCPAVAGQGGRATFPAAAANVDGVMVNQAVFGPASGPYMLGRITVHEVGHYFTLYHTFQGGCAGTDLVADTPPQQNPNFGCPAFPHVTCNNGPNGDMFVNYMDYTDDACKVMFTLGQVARMQAALAGPRATLLASDGSVPPPVPDVADLWSADTPFDTGIEPDPVGAPMWQSEDIWIRNTNDGLVTQDHQNPIHRPGGSPPNFVYVRIRNRSCGSPASGTVKLYWAKASSALSWPAPFDGTVLVPALMGGSIGVQPVGPVPGRGSVILEFPWSPPDPADYGMFGGDQDHFCLLSRIETAAASPFGMSSPETSDLNANVRNNNNIVWKNVEVVTSGNLELPGSITIGNQAEREQQTLLAIVPAGLHDLGEVWDHVELVLDADFAGMLGRVLKESPAVTIEGDRLLVREFGKPFGPFVLQPGEYHTVGLRIVPTEQAPPYGVFPVDLIQYEQRGKKQLVTGGQRVAFKVMPDTTRISPPVIGRWWHSHEEDEDEAQAFRPEGYEFPVSLGRWGFELREDRSAVVLDIAPTEGVEEIEGYWWAEGERVYVGLADPDRADVSIRVHSATEDKLVLSRSDTDPADA